MFCQNAFGQSLYVVGSLFWPAAAYSVSFYSRRFSCCERRTCPDRASLAPLRAVRRTTGAPSWPRPAPPRNLSREFDIHAELECHEPFFIGHKRLHEPVMTSTCSSGHSNDHLAVALPSRTQTKHQFKFCWLASRSASRCRITNAI